MAFVAYYSSAQPPNGLNPALLGEQAAAVFAARYVNIDTGDTRGLGLHVTHWVDEQADHAAFDALILAHNGAQQTAGQILEAEKAADKAAMQQAQADQAIADINTALLEAQVDLAGWDAMTTNDKIAASKRMLSRQIGVLQRQRKVIKYVRWL